MIDLVDSPLFRAAGAVVSRVVLLPLLLAVADDASPSRRVFREPLFTTPEVAEVVDVGFLLPVLLDEVKPPGLLPGVVLRLLSRLATISSRKSKTA